jgi:NTE family protein
MEAEPEGVRKLGLALSGGGFRSAFFHLGVLAQLATLGLLRTVSVISTVSGGSIVGALYYAHVKRRFEDPAQEPPDDAAFCDIVRDVERELLDGVRKNVRVKTLANYVKIVKMSRLDYSRTDRLGELLSDTFFGSVLGGTPPARMKDLAIAPAHPSEWGPPELIMNATTLNTGHSWRFEVTTMGEPPLIEDMDRDVDRNLRLLRPSSYAEMGDHAGAIPLGIAVGASAAVPGMFFPLSISKLYPDDIRVQLVDGGVHDNQGVGALIERECTHFIVSDAGGQLDDAPNAAPWLLSSLKRSAQIQYGRVRQEQLLRLTHSTSALAERPVALVHIRSGIPALEEPWARDVETPTEAMRPEPHPAGGPSESFGVHGEVQEALSRIRTDLDAFSDVEAIPLIADGYRIAGHVVHQTPQMSGLIRPASPAPAWRFEEADVDTLLRDGPEYPRFLSQLRVGSTRFFKVFMLHTPSLVALLLALSLFGILVAEVAGHEIARPFRAHVRLWIVLVVVLGGIVLFVSLSARARLGKVIEAIVVPLSLVAQVLLGWIVALWMSAYLILLNDRFLRAGRLERVRSTRPKTWSPPFGPAVERWFRPALIVAILIVAASVVLGAIGIARHGPSEPPGLFTTAAPHGIVSLELAGTKEKADGIVDSWGAPAQRSARHGVVLDYAFIVIYSTALAFAMIVAAEARRRRGLLARTDPAYRAMHPGNALRIEKAVVLGIALSWAMWGAGLFDALENVFLLRILGIRIGGGELTNSFLPRMATLFAGAKFVLLGIGVLYAVLALASSAPSLLRKR